MAEKLGITMRLPPIQPRSRHAHEAVQWARTQNRFDDYNVALFRAFFERGENIGEIEILVSLASNLGMDGDSLRRALENHDFTESVLADELAAEEIGVSGVPAFVANRATALSGVQSAEGLKRLIEYARGLPD
jgi:predicted DsbA family dithiol-disulfide isomerase